MSRKPKSVNPSEIDPSVYYYDEDYDDMKNEESLAKQSAQEEKHKSKQSSKYIRGLIETANERKSDKEVRKFKKYAKDREEAKVHGELDGEEIFVTSAYKRKLDEIKRIDADKKRRLEQEEKRKLNFIKDEKHHKKSSNRKIQPTETEKVDIQPLEEKRDEVLEFDGTEEGTIVRRRRPQSVEERREYLRELLAKRTVGEKFEAALERYNQRKQTIQKPHQ